MGVDTIIALLGALGTFLAVFGGGAKWLLNHMDQKSKEALASIEAAAKESAAKEEKARAELYQRLQGEISDLRNELLKVQKEKQLYLKRIYQLEYFIHTQPGIDIPTMDGWPPV